MSELNLPPEIAKEYEDYLERVERVKGTGYGVAVDGTTKLWLQALRALSNISNRSRRICPICWTSSYEPTEDGERCLCCWQHERIIELLADNDTLKAMNTRILERWEKADKVHGKAIEILQDKLKVKDEE